MDWTHTPETGIQHYPTCLYMESTEQEEERKAEYFMEGHSHCRGQKAATKHYNSAHFTLRYSHTILIIIRFQLKIKHRVANIVFLHVDTNGPIF